MGGPITKGNDVAGAVFSDRSATATATGYGWYRAIRYDLKCRDEMVIEIRRKVYDALDLIGNRVMQETAETLEGHGLVKREQRA